MFQGESDWRPNLLVGGGYGTISWSCPGKYSGIEARSLANSHDRARDPTCRHEEETTRLTQQSHAATHVALVCLTFVTASGSCASLLTLNEIAQEVQRGDPTLLHSDYTYLVALGIYVFSTALFCHLRRLAGDTSIRFCLAVGLSLGMTAAALLAMDHIQVFLLFIPGSCWIALMLAWIWSIVSSSRSNGQEARAAQLFVHADKMEGGGSTCRV